MSQPFTPSRQVRNRLPFGQRRAPIHCAPTMLGAAPTGAGEVPFEALFLAHYRAIRRIARVRRPGVGVLAVHLDDYRTVASAWIARRPDRTYALLVGRHDRCDLVLDAPSVSLRHLVLLLPPTGHWPMQYKLHELHTGEGMQGELQQPLSGARVERFGVFRIGPYALFTFATGAPSEWPELASEAWAQMRGSTVPTESRRAEWAPTNRSSPWRPPPLTTSVIALPGPLRASSRLLAPGELPAATIQIATERRVRRLALGPCALEQGIVLGRYTRCDSVLGDPSISRVHLLLIAAGTEIIAVDTASENGVYVDSDVACRERVITLSRGQRAVLGDGKAVVELVR